MSDPGASHGRFSIGYQERPDYLEDRGRWEAYVSIWAEEFPGDPWDLIAVGDDPQDVADRARAAARTLESWPDSLLHHFTVTESRGWLVPVSEVAVYDEMAPAYRAAETP